MVTPPPRDWAGIYEVLAREVPEIAAGTVQIRAAARAPGGRTKVALASGAPDLIDPIGPCVGWRGHRARAIKAALGGAFDLIVWSDIPEILVERALAPARVVAVSLDLDRRRAVASVPVEQVPIALGQDGVNRDLASQLTGWTIDIIAADAA